jgi:hypothetical protein
MPYMKFNGASTYSQKIANLMSQTNQVHTHYFKLTLTISFQSSLDLVSGIRTTIMYVLIVDLTLGDQQDIEFIVNAKFCSLSFLPACEIHMLCCQ